MTKKKTPPSLESKESKVLRGLNSEIKAIVTGSLGSDGFYLSVIKASIAKCYEFCVFAERSNVYEDSFFSSGTLRGICEDLIVLSYLKSFDPSDREEIVSALAFSSMWEGLSIQDVFFTATRPWQPIVRLEDAANRKKATEDTLASFRKKYAWKSRRIWPTTREMAEVCGLLSLYEFLFAATSKLIHCNPHVLLRMGWTAPMDEESFAQLQIPAKAMAETFIFSTKKFGGYYAQCNRVYGNHLFVLLCRAFEEMLGLNRKVMRAIDQLASLGKAELRWPEVVTFEELNFKPPSIHPLQYALRGQILLEELKELID